MANRVILEIDQQQVRALSARMVGPRVHVTHAVRLPIAADQSWTAVADACAREMAKHHFGRGDADVIVNRRSVEMRDIKVPPAPDDELPDLLRFVAKNEFATVTDQWQLDFVPLSDDSSVGRTVIAAALSPQWRANIELLCERCGLKLRRILLRPFLDTLIVAEHRLLSDGVNLLVHRVAETVDLTLTQQGRVLLSRSVLLAGHDEGELERETAQEIRRTVLTAPRVGEGRAVDRVLLIGPEASVTRVRELLGDWTGSELVACDPLDDHAFQLSREFTQLERPEQFAAHFGALQSLSSARVPQIDFANPRRRKEKKIDKRRVALYASLAAIVIVGAGLLIWQTLSSQQSAIAQLQKEYDTLRQENLGDRIRPGVDDLIGEVQLVDQWMAGKIDWTAQLLDISRRLLTADQTILDSFTGLVLRNQELKISISGQLDTNESGFQIQKQLSDPPYRIAPGKLAQDSKLPEYPFSYGLDLFAELSDFDTAQSVNERIREQAEKWQSSPSTPIGAQPGDPAAPSDTQQPPE